MQTDPIAHSSDRRKADRRTPVQAGETFDAWRERRDAERRSVPTGPRLVGVDGAHSIRVTTRVEQATRAAHVKIGGGMTEVAAVFNVAASHGLTEEERDGLARSFGVA